MATHGRKKQVRNAPRNTGNAGGKSSSKKASDSKPGGNSTPANNSTPISNSAPARDLTPANNSTPTSDSATRKKLRGLTDAQLLRRVEKLDTRERQLTLSILYHLAEIDYRRLYRRQGYSSLFDFCLRHLNYSEAAAGRRIRAARCIRDYPEVAARFEAREVSVTTISRISGIMTRKNCTKLLDAVSGKRRNDVEMVVSRFRPRERIIEKVKPVFVLTAVPVGSAGDSHGDPLLDNHVHPFRDELANPHCNGNGDPLTEKNGIPSHTGSCSQNDSYDEGGKSSTAASGGKNPCSRDGFKVERTECGSALDQADSSPSTRHTMTQKLKYRLEFGIDPDLMEKIEKVKGLLSTKYPGNVSLELLLAELIDEYLDRHSPEARKFRRDKRKAAKAEAAKKGHRRPDNAQAGRVSSDSEDLPDSENVPDSEDIPGRHIPDHIRDEIYSRDGGRCTFVGPDGTKCGSEWNVQVDHIRPYSKGGDHSPENLRLLCANHNRHEAERVIGIGAMKKFRKRE